MRTNKLEYQYFYRRNLPHIQPVGAIFFISYRLAFDLPREILLQLNDLRRFYDTKIENVDKVERSKLKKTCNKYLFEIEDSYLHNAQDTPMYLQIAEVANIVIDSLQFNEKKLYHLHLAMIMPNDVHLLIQPLIKSGKPVSLAKIMKDHKSFTANECNKILQRSGQFWHHENYDHYIRDEKEYEKIKSYILNNPVKSGLVDHYKNWKYKIINDFSKTEL